MNQKVPFDSGEIPNPSSFNDVFSENLALELVKLLEESGVEDMKEYYFLDGKPYFF